MLLNRASGCRPVYHRYFGGVGKRGGYWLSVIGYWLLVIGYRLVHSCRARCPVQVLLLRVFGRLLVQGQEPLSGRLRRDDWDLLISVQPRVYLAYGGRFTCIIMGDTLHRATLFNGLPGTRALLRRFSYLIGHERS